MKLSKSKAKKLTIEIWQYLTEHPDIAFKEDLPPKIYDKVKDMVSNCPSCNSEIDRDQNAGINLKNYGLKELGLGQPETKPVEKQVSTLEEITEQATFVKQEADWSSANR